MSEPRPVFPVGVAYHAIDDERRSWSDWYDRDADADFASLAEHRISLARVFVSWHCLEPQVGQYDEDAAERLDRVVAAAGAHGIRLIVTFFADDRVAELMDVAWGKRRDPRTDDYLIGRESALVQRIVNRYRADDTIFAWDLGNEAFLSGFTSAEDLDRWAGAMRDAVREVDPDRPIMLSADPETLFRSSRVDATHALDRFELGASHVTSAYVAFAAEGPVTSGPATYIDGYLLRCASRGLPVLMDEVGAVSLDASVGEEAAAVRTSMWSGLMNGAAGVVLRRWRDMETERREPYFRDPFEFPVGVVDTNGSPKPVLAEVRRFARVALALDRRRYEPAAEDVAVLLPAERYHALPSMAGLYGPRSCLQSYIRAKEAHLPVTLVREGEEIGRLAALIVPSVAELEPGTWEALAAWVQDGGSLVMSYGGGDPPAEVRGLFGIEFLGDHGRRETFACRVAQSDLLPGLVPFDCALPLQHHALLGQAGATVVATDATGSPLVTLQRHGQGRAVFVAAPIERALAQGDPWAAPDAAASFVRTVYASVADACGAAGSVRCDRPGVEVAHFLGEADDILLLLNHSPEKTVATLSFDRAVASVADVRGGAAAPVEGGAFGVPLGANGVAALRVNFA
ncbi:MAG: cellulase family glycosylhydrolase [Coriobacteriia bacterium]